MCPDLEQLSAYIDGELDPQDLNSIKTHLGECEVCRAEVESFSSLSFEMGRDIPEIPAGLEERIRDRVLHTNTEFRHTSKRSFWNRGSVSIPVPIAVAAGLVLFFTATFSVVSNFGGNATASDSVAVEKNAVDAASPREVAFGLADEIEMEVPLNLDVDVDSIYFGDSEMIKEEDVVNE